MARPAPTSPVKAKTTALLHKLKRSKSSQLAFSAEVGRGGKGAGAAPPTGGDEPVVDVRRDSLEDLEKQAAEMTITDQGSKEAPLAKPKSSSSADLSGVSISVSPFLPSTDMFEGPPNSSPAAQLRVRTDDASPSDPADISLPLPSPSEDAALTLTDVVELQAFVDKKRWIEEQIEVLRGLQPIDCFVDRRPTFAGGTVDEECAQDELPSREQVHQMLAEHERIEAEAEKLDGGEITRLRQMAKAASKKSLSREDTDLLDITLSTLFLLDTLLHLLRDRADTLDLLALRLDWDARRFNIAVDVHAIEKDVRSFVEGKGRWSVDAYKQAAEAPTAVGESDTSSILNTRRNRRGSDASVKSVSSARSIGLSNSTASRSQRFLMTQVLELDCQSFQNRISSLRSGPVAQTGRLLDRMIDVAASIRARNKKRAAHEAAIAGSSLLEGDKKAAEVKPSPPSATATSAEADGGALPDWFLDEMDRVEEEVDHLRLHEELARAHGRQWKAADLIYHTARKTQADADALLADIDRSFLQHPDLERSNRYSEKAAGFLAILNSIGDLKTHPALAIPPSVLASASYIAPTSDASVVGFLTLEVASAAHAADAAREQAAAYRRLAERTLKLEALRLDMEGLAISLQEAHGQLSSGPSRQADEQPPDLSSTTCLQPEAHSAYLARLPGVTTDIQAAVDRSGPVLKETTALLMALKTSGMDPNFRSVVQATSVRLQEAIAKATNASSSASKLACALASHQRIHVAQEDVFKRLAAIRLDVLKTLESSKWTKSALPPDGSPQTAWEDVLTPLVSLIDGTIVPPMSSLDNAMRQTHPELFTHLNERSLTLDASLGALRELATKLLPSLLQQAKAMDRFATRVEELRAKSETLRTRFATAAEVDDDAVQVDSEVEQLLASLHNDVPFVSSPALSRALTFDGLQAGPLDHGKLLTPSRSPTGLPSTSSLSSAPSVGQQTAPFPPAIDLTEIDAIVRQRANALASELIRERELLREVIGHVPRKRFDAQAEAVDAALSRVLDLVDAIVPQELGVLQCAAARQALQKGLDALSSAFAAVAEFATTLPDTAAAQVEVERLRQAVDEMTDMAQGVLHPTRERSRSASVASNTSTIASDVAHSEDQRGNTTSARTTMVSSGSAPLRPSIRRSSSSRSVASASSRTSGASPPCISDASTPTKTASLNKSGRPHLPSTLLRPTSSQSLRSISSPVNTSSGHARLARPTSSASTATGPSAFPRPRTSSGISSTKIATPTRPRDGARHPSDFFSPSVLSPPAGSTSTTLRRSVRYRSPAPVTTPSSTTVSRTPASVGRQRVGSAVSAHEDGALATPSRRSVSASAPRERNSRKPYVPKRGHKLDRAVGKIVNAMPMEITIVPAREETDTETGRYWIGVPPRLCFCRILRSRSVMVRVGGGWVELSKFLRDHFKDMIPSEGASPSRLLSPAVFSPAQDSWIAGGGGGGGPATPSRPLGSRSTSLASSASHDLFPIADSSPAKLSSPGTSSPTAAVTPDHHPSTERDRRARKVSASPLTPSFTTPRSMTVLVASPAASSFAADDGAPLGPGSPGSPALVPLQLMRKADPHERSSPASSFSAASGAAYALGVGSPTGIAGRAAASARRSVSGGSATGASAGGQSRPSIPWRF